jgi:hypothetical protein
MQDVDLYEMTMKEILNEFEETVGHLQKCRIEGQTDMSQIRHKEHLREHILHRTIDYPLMDAHLYLEIGVLLRVLPERTDIMDLTREDEVSREVVREIYRQGEQEIQKAVRQRLDETDE